MRRKLDARVPLALFKRGSNPTLVLACEILAMDGRETVRQKIIKLLLTLQTSDGTSPNVEDIINAVIFDCDDRGDLIDFLHDLFVEVNNRNATLSGQTLAVTAGLIVLKSEHAFNLDTMSGVDVTNLIASLLSCFGDIRLYTMACFLGISVERLNADINTFVSTAIKDPARWQRLQKVASAFEISKDVPATEVEDLFIWKLVNEMAHKIITMIGKDRAQLVRFVSETEVPLPGAVPAK